MGDYYVGHLKIEYTFKKQVNKKTKKGPNFFFFNCDLHGVFSQDVQVVPWYLTFRFGRVADVSPQLDFVGGGVFPPGITNICKKSYLCQFLMDSNDLYICE